jgi:hypothetical protein
LSGVSSPFSLRFARPLFFGMSSSISKTAFELN